MINKFKNFSIILFCLALSIPVVVFAANDITVETGLSIVLPSDSSSYTVGTNTTVQYFNVNDSTIDFIVEASSIINLSYAGIKNFSVSNIGGCSITEQSCSATDSSITITCPASMTEKTVTIIPSGTSCSTKDSGSSGGVGAYTPPVAPVTPTLPTTAPIVSQTVVEKTCSVGTAAPISVGASSHTVTVQSASASEATVKITSEPITVILKKDESKEVDTNGDGQKDLKVAYLGLVSGKPKLQFVNLTDEGELKNAVAINYGAYETDSPNVVLKLNATNATQVAISNKNNFTGIAFVAYKNTVSWTLTAGDGVKTVYVRFKSSTAGTSDASDTIKLVKQGIKEEIVKEETAKETKTVSCSFTIGAAYKSSDSPAVYYITDKCEKRVFNKSNVFFTYFSSWKDVKTATKTELKALKNDTLGFMPWGPKYDPKYGALVKIVTDPKVYLLLGGEKYWITDEAVFNKLSYKWNWIEDIDKALLDKYTIGSEINFTDHHANYTLVKYTNNAKVYRLEPDPKDTTKQVKRWVPDEKTFNKLNFRWDRIVTVADTEKYIDGEQLTQ